MREVKVTFTLTDNEDDGKEMSNTDLVAVWQEFLEENVEANYDMEDLKVERVVEIDRDESIKDIDDEEEEG